MSSKRIKVKPGKTQSKIGFFAGILFVIIGCVMVIPMFGLFGIVWTALAAGITYVNYKNAFSDEGVASHEIVIEDGTEMERSSGKEEDIESKLKKLNSLYEQRLITREEYDEKKKDLLNRF